MESYTEKKTLKDRLFHGVMWNMIGLGLSKGITLILSIVIARVLKPEIYGQYGMINSTVSMFAVFAGLGLGVTSTRYIAEYRKSQPQRIGNIVALTNSVAIITGVIMASILFFSAEWLAEYYLGTPQLSDELRIVSWLLIFNTFTGVQTGSLSGFEQFKKIAFVSTINGIISLPIIMTGVLLAGLKGLLWANVIVAVILAIMNTYTISIVFKEHNIKLNVRGALREKEILWKTSLPAMLSNAMVGPITWYVNTIILGMDNGFAEIGLFNAAYQWRAILSFIPATITSVFLPILVVEKNNSKMEKINILFSWIVVTMCALPILAYPEIIAIFYGKDYNGYNFKAVLVLTALIACVLAYKEGISRKIISENLMWFSFMSNFIWGGLLIIFTYLFRSKGAIGLSLAYLLSYLINTVIFIPYYLRKGIVNKDLLISKNVALVWAIIGLQLVVGIMNLSILVKTIIMIINIIIMGLLVMRISGMRIRRERCQ